MYGMSNYNNAINKLFSEREKLIILGLTGRTGAGCTTTAKILSQKFEDLDLEYIEGDEPFLNISEKYKFDIIKKYIGYKSEDPLETRWVPFTIIEGSCVILSFVFDLPVSGPFNSDMLINYLIELQDSDNAISFKIDNFESLEQDLHGLEYIFKTVSRCRLDDINADWSTWQGQAITKNKIEEYYKLYIQDISVYRDRIKNVLQRYSCYEEKQKKLQDDPPIKYHLYTYLLQKLGNNIRASGEPYCEKFYPEKMFTFAQRIEKLITLVQRYDSITGKTQTRICIDAIRNVTESNYLKDRFRPYYLLSISAEEKQRKGRLSDFDEEERQGLDFVEYESKLNAGEYFYHQNIASCFEMADIHLVNNDVQDDKKFFLTWQLVKYITLMIHPGLITPSAIERSMQVAFNAKYNSGCLSRQVGAVVTDADYVIKAIGWNEVPKGQLSCSLRSVDNYCKGNMPECYSQFETEDPGFKKVLNYVKTRADDIDFHGRNFAYCFKDIYNGYKNEKNQVYTRALHAEENAFLQVSKYGGQGIRGGYLFCTASPCELCAKKAYQLGIDRIYYIDPYPGISQRHILRFGKEKTQPRMDLFFGAIGEAYIRLYRPLLPFKDELKFVTGIDLKNEAKEALHRQLNGPKTLDFFYHIYEVTLEFIDRENIVSSRHAEITIENHTFTQLERRLTWTGSSYDGSRLENNTEGYNLIDTKDKISPYYYTIEFNKTLQKGDKIKYTVHTDVKDEMHLMHPYLSHTILHPMEKLVLKVITPKKGEIIEEVHYVRYADKNMECEYKDTDHDVKIEEKDDKIEYTLTIDRPNLFYSYSLEWAFIKIKP